MRRLAWYFLVMQAIGFGLYPLMFLLTDMSGGLLSTKPATLLENQAWQFFFYLHIIAGGLALLSAGHSSARESDVAGYRSTDLLAGFTWSPSC